MLSLRDGLQKKIGKLSSDYGLKNRWEKICEVFHLFENNPAESDMLNKCKMGRAREAVRRLRKKGGMQLGPN